MFVLKGGRVVNTSPRNEAVDARFAALLNLPDLRNKLFIAAKINTTGKQAGIDQMRQMQRLWSRNTLDLIQIESMRDVEVHWPSVRIERFRSRSQGGICPSGNVRLHARELFDPRTTRRRTLVTARTRARMAC
jgi:hypothetical protein